MDLPVAGRVQHLQVAESIPPTLAAPDHVVRVPAAFERDGLSAVRAFALLRSPQAFQFGGQSRFHAGLQAFFKVHFPGRVERVGLAPDFDVPADGGANGVVQVYGYGFVAFANDFTAERPGAPAVGAEVVPGYPVSVLAFGMPHTPA